MIGLSRNKGLLPAVTTRRILIQVKLETQLKNDAKGDHRLNGLKAPSKHHKLKTRNLPAAETNAVNVGMLGIMPRPARNSKRYQWRKTWYRGEVRNRREMYYHCNSSKVVQYKTFQTYNFVDANLAIYLSLLLALSIILALSFIHRK